MAITALQIAGTLIHLIVLSNEPEQGECSGSCTADANCTSTSYMYCELGGGEGQCCPESNDGGAHGESVSRITDALGQATTIVIIYIICKYRTHAGVKKYKTLFFCALSYCFLTNYLPWVLTGDNTQFLRVLRFGAIPIPMLIVYAAYKIKQDFAATDEGTYSLFGGNPMLSASLVAADDRRVAPAAAPPPGDENEVVRGQVVA